MLRVHRLLLLLLLLLLLMMLLLLLVMLLMLLLLSRIATRVVGGRGRLGREWIILLLLLVMDLTWGGG